MLQNYRDQIVRNLFDNMNTIKRGMAVQMHTLNRGYPVSHAQLELLSVIRQTQPISFKHLAQQLHLTPGAISQLAEGLEQHHIIYRESDPQDRRTQSLQLTKKGSRLLRTVEKRRKGIMDAIIAGLTDEELAGWLRVQEKMLQHLQSDSVTQTKQGAK